MNPDGEEDRPALGQFAQGLALNTKVDFIGRIVFRQPRVQSFTRKSVWLEQIGIIIEAPVEPPDGLTYF